jgi:DNA-binding MarR family transcriptional regulator
MAPPDNDTAEQLQHFATRLIKLARSTHKQHSLSSAQYSVMAVLNERPGSSVVELARREAVTHPTMSRIIAGLIKSGFVVREPDPSDKRSGMLHLTPAGLQLYREVTERRVLLFRVLLAQLRPETIAEILEVTARLAEPLEMRFRNE